MTSPTLARPGTRSGSAERAPSGDPVGVGWALAWPLILPVAIPGLLPIVSLINAWSALGSATIVGALAVLVAPVLVWLLATSAWSRHGTTRTAIAAALLALIAVALAVCPTIAAVSTGTTGIRGSEFGEDTRRWVTEPVESSELVRLAVIAVTLVLALGVAGWLFRRAGWAVAAVWIGTLGVGFTWIPLIGFLAMGNGLASRSPLTPTVSVLWSLPFLAHLTAPVAALLAGAVLARDRRPSAG